MEAAVVATPDEKWGETPSAFVLLKPDAAGATELELIAWFREDLAHFRTPRTIVFDALPQELDRQDPEVRSAGTSESAVNRTRSTSP